MTIPPSPMRLALHNHAGHILASADGAWQRTYVLPEGTLPFAGHFPGHAVLPAITQCLMVQMTVEEALGKKMRIAGIPQAKFTAPLLPGQTIVLSVRGGRKADHWDALLHGDAVLAAKLQLHLLEVEE